MRSTSYSAARFASEDLRGLIPRMMAIGGSSHAEACQRFHHRGPCHKSQSDLREKYVCELLGRSTNREAVGKGRYATPGALPTVA